MTALFININPKNNRAKVGEGLRRKSEDITQWKTNLNEKYIYVC